MFCNKCGQAIPQGSQFCNHCGARVPGGQPEPSTYPSRSQRVEVPFGDDPGPRAQGARNQPLLGGVDEEVLFTIRPTMIFVYVWYAVAVAVVLGVSVLLGVLASYQIGRASCRERV